MAKIIALPGFCSTTKKPLGYQFKVENDGNYYAVGSFALSAGMKTEGTETYTGKFLIGDSFSCKFCQNDNFIRCGCCDALFCCRTGTPELVCPSCGRNISISWVTADEIEASSLKGGRQ